jgi:hypothetical protein
MNRGDMNRGETWWMRSPQGREPISRFILTVGLVDAVIGGVGGYGALTAIGLAAVGVAMGLRWRIGRLRIEPIEPGKTRPVRYLPSRSSRTALPVLESSRGRKT